MDLNIVFEQISEITGFLFELSCLYFPRSRPFCILYDDLNPSNMAVNAEMMRITALLNFEYTNVSVSDSTSSRGVALISIPSTRKLYGEPRNCIVGHRDTCKKRQIPETEDRSVRGIRRGKVKRLTL